MKKENKSSNSKKYALLVETAKNLFFRHGIKRITVEEICEKSNVSKVTFYKYFSDKKELAELISDELIDYSFSKLDEIRSLNISFPEKIELITKWRVHFFSNISSDFIEDILDIDGINERVKSYYLSNIIEAQSKGEIRKELSPELIWMVTEKLNEIVKDGSWKNAFEDYNTFKIQLRKMYFCGILADPDTH